MKNIPRIIKIHDVQGFKVYCVFNNGDHRIIDFHKLFAHWDTQPGDPAHRITRSEDFQRLQLVNNTLGWPHIEKFIQLSDGKTFQVPLELDPVVLYDLSDPDFERNKRYRIGHDLRMAREAAGLTQEELAKRSGTTKNYISRIENNRSDIALKTLRKIIEVGLGMKLDIVIRTGDPN